MYLKIKDIDLVEISAIFTCRLQEEVADIIKDNNLSENLVGFFKSETHLHTQKVSDFASLLAKKVGLSDKEVKTIIEIAPFHDFGKLAIAEEILAKPDKLTLEEFEIIKTHSVHGYKMLKNSGNNTLDLAAIVCLEHHEKWDGTGYPYGLKQGEIHLYSRIISIADVLDSLISERCYKKAWEKEKVREFFKEQSGKQFDPFLISIFLKHFDEFVKNGGDNYVQ
jgi:HD-GYP domain-containing protein (c-di-GMP phosphodiesterase class II)